jgi:hypothetical protein
MTMNVRDDGSRMPDRKAELAVLADISDSDAETGKGYDYNVTLGDLIVQALIGRPLYDGTTGSHEDWESFEIAIMQRMALELRALNIAMATELTTDDYPSDGFSTEQACECVRGMASRLEAGTELARRLRDARWGHPSFGGGEKFLEEQQAKFRAEVAARAEGSESDG